MENKNNKTEIYLNYKRKNKWLGIIDYKSLIFISIYIFIIVSILRIIPLKIEYLIYIFIVFVIPVVTLIFVNIGDESAVDTLIMIFKFYINNKIYVKKEYYKKLDKKVYKNLEN